MFAPYKAFYYKKELLKALMSFSSFSLNFGAHLDVQDTHKLVWKKAKSIELQGPADLPQEGRIGGAERRGERDIRSLQTE